MIYFSTDGYRTWMCSLTFSSNLLKVLGWAQAMPKFANDLVKYVQTFLERTYERCRTAYMEVLFFPFRIKNLEWNCPIMKDILSA